ncbi:MAG: DNA glycosylase AlkZ-like family protein [Propionibacteriaceae bacterium]
MTVTLAQLRRYAVGRSLFRPTTLRRAIERLGFVQADPIRQPARAQDLILRHRVSGYRAGDLERRYARLPIEEDAFVNYGYLPRATATLMHPRKARKPWDAVSAQRAEDVLEFVRTHGTVHPREVENHFQHGRVTNWFGGSSNATTQLLDGMHYRGLLRVVSRASGTRTYALADRPAVPVEPDDAMDLLLDVAVRLYAPLPRRTLRLLGSLLGYGAPQWRDRRVEALLRAEERLACATVDGVQWFWPGDEDPTRRWTPKPLVRLLAPFDPVVWDRHRFELFWGWEYKFEAYTPAAQRVRGYYSLPLLWRDKVVGWGNLLVRDGDLLADIGYVDGQPKDAVFAPALEDELGRMRTFLGLET